MIHWFLKPAMQCIKLEEVNLSPKSSVFRFNIKWICMRGSGSGLYERCKVSSLEWIVNSDVINWYTLINSPLLFSVIFDCVCIFNLRDEIYSLRVLCFVLFFFLVLHVNSFGGQLLVNKICSVPPTCHLAHPLKSKYWGPLCNSFLVCFC